MIHDLWFAPLLRCPATIYWAAPIVLSFVILRPMPEENGVDQAHALRALRIARSARRCWVFIARLNCCSTACCCYE